MSTPWNYKMQAGEVIQYDDGLEVTIVAFRTESRGEVIDFYVSWITPMLTFEVAAFERMIEEAK